MFIDFMQNFSGNECQLKVYDSSQSALSITNTLWNSFIPIGARLFVVRFAQSGIVQCFLIVYVFHHRQTAKIKRKNIVFCYKSI